MESNNAPPVRRGDTVLGRAASFSRYVQRLVAAEPDLQNRVEFLSPPAASAMRARLGAFAAAGVALPRALRRLRKEVMLAVIAGPFDERISDFYRVASVPEANGRNLVNVIIVDFRALDTLGEITVLGFAAIAAGAVLATVRRERSPSR